MLPAWAASFIGPMFAFLAVHGSGVICVEPRVETSTRGGCRATPDPRTPPSAGSLHGWAARVGMNGDKCTVRVQGKVLLLPVTSARVRKRANHRRPIRSETPQPTTMADISTASRQAVIKQDVHQLSSHRQPQRRADRTSSSATLGSRRNWRIRTAKAAAASCAWRWVASPDEATKVPARPRVSITASRSSSR